MRTILKAEDLSKQYRLGLVGTGSMAHDLNRWWYTLRGKEDPYLKIGEENDRSTKGSSDYVWALQDINFEVQQGEVLGIIGKNGAGKSTLLKILSRVTAPTTGVIKTRGRIASLLEVGTGFHGELTGRENIYMNGAILGMTKREITAKLDEIIAFSGCERYIDTPVKRYSSGMTVRLGFAVAAHLEPDILVVDEVLAVGDAEFQKKAIGKMQDVSRSEGRTVLFVSHNMAAVKSLCTRGMVLENGKMAFTGTAEEGVDWYLGNMKKDNQKIRIIKKGLDADKLFLEEASIFYENKEKGYISYNQKFKVIFDLKIGLDKTEINYSLNIFNENDILVLNSYTNVLSIERQNLRAEFDFPECFFNDGLYTMELMVVKNHNQIILSIPNVINFEIIDDDIRNSNWFGKHSGIVRPKVFSKLKAF